MRKAVYLLAIMFSLVLVSTSCEKGDEATPEDEVPTGIQPSDIVGSWGFVSLEFNGTTYTGCDTELKDYDWATLSLNNVTTIKLEMYNQCDDWGFPYDYGISKNEQEKDILIIEKLDVKFEISKIEMDDKIYLKLKLVDKGTNRILPEGGTYTLQKL